MASATQDGNKVGARIQFKSDALKMQAYEKLRERALGPGAPLNFWLVRGSPEKGGTPLPQLPGAIQLRNVSMKNPFQGRVTIRKMAIQSLREALKGKIPDQARDSALIEESVDCRRDTRTRAKIPLYTIRLYATRGDYVPILLDFFRGKSLLVDGSSPVQASGFGRYARCEICDQFGHIQDECQAPTIRLQSSFRINPNMLEDFIEEVGAVKGWLGHYVLPEGGRSGVDPPFCYLLMESKDAQIKALPQVMAWQYAGDICCKAIIGNGIISAHKGNTPLCPLQQALTKRRDEYEKELTLVTQEVVNHMKEMADVRDRMEDEPSSSDGTGKDEKDGKAYGNFEEEGPDLSCTFKEAKESGFQNFSSSSSSSSHSSSSSSSTGTQYSNSRPTSHLAQMSRTNRAQLRGPKYPNWIKNTSNISSAKSRQKKTRRAPDQSPKGIAEYPRDDLPLLSAAVPGALPWGPPYAVAPSTLPIGSHGQSCFCVI